MEVILLENIKKLGSIGQKVKVKDGYGRNFLIKRNNCFIRSIESKNLCWKNRNKKSN